MNLEYICATIGNLAGIPVRLFKDGELIFYRSLVDLPKDPMNVYKKEIDAVDAHIGYYVTPIFNYYGIVNSSPYKIVIGPSRHAVASDADLKELAFRADVASDDLDRFLTAMKTIVYMPLESVMQILCVVNHVLNGEIINLKDIKIYDETQKQLNAIAEQEELSKPYEKVDTEDFRNPHNSYAIEQKITDFVRHGDTQGLLNWVQSAPAIREGILSDNYVRQKKNTFIVSATLMSRASIRGGLDIEDALALCDSYIRKCELLSRVDEIDNLHFHMVRDLTERVERIHIGKNSSSLAIEVAKYVQKHISEVKSVEEIANQLFMSRPHLSTKFKEETGMTLTDFILTEKTNEAKRLLSFTDKPLSAISNYLGFSSQSHFARVFKKYAGLSPSEYREKHK